ncbi:hypothetical protein PMIN01_01076 [Paraphaeosphaeria minitans]|uniref:Uncharacterized protein n=1 Tax=Paraphaeosphaeria minitans TaxID=565426 RepID=A0A9P6GTG7_9PLEO|nr:hypothetical protein PMIN01_01076 [Paraphaeosphaeria minitans]
MTESLCTSSAPLTPSSRWRAPRPKLYPQRSTPTSRACRPCIGPPIVSPSKSAAHPREARRTPAPSPHRCARSAAPSALLSETLALALAPALALERVRRSVGEFAARTFTCMIGRQGFLVAPGGARKGERWWVGDVEPRGLGHGLRWRLSGEVSPRDAWWRPRGVFGLQLHAYARQG